MKTLAIATIMVFFLGSCDRKPTPPDNFLRGEIVEIKLSGEKVSIVDTYGRHGWRIYKVRNHEGHVRELFSEELKGLTP